MNGVKPIKQPCPILTDMIEFFEFHKEPNKTEFVIILFHEGKKEYPIAMSPNRYREFLDGAIAFSSKLKTQ